MHTLYKKMSPTCSISRIKGLRAENLRTNSLRSENLRTEHRDRKRENLVLIDSLTGLASQQRFDRHLSEEFQRAYRCNHHLALLLINVDDFKQYSALYGRFNSDLLLKSLSHSWNQCIGFPGDMLARYSSDEFAAVLPYANATDAQIIAQKFITVARYQQISISIGMALSHEAATVERLVYIADQRLHQT